MFGIATWLAQYDQFGNWAKFRYRGKDGYGTGLGGLCSIFLTLITTAFIGI